MIHPCLYEMSLPAINIFLNFSKKLLALNQIHQKIAFLFVVLYTVRTWSLKSQYHSLIKKQLKSTSRWIMVLLPSKCTVELTFVNILISKKVFR